MSCYLDTSVLVSLFVQDANTQRAVTLLPIAGELSVSDFAAAEFASAVAGLVRSHEVRDRDRAALFSRFDVWCARKTRRVELATSDIALAESLLRQADLGLRTPDAIHLAIVQRMGLPLATFDRKMADAAATLGLALT